MNTEIDLMDPRIKAIAEDTSGRFTKGEVFYADEGGKFMVYEDWGGWEIKYELYPHLFQPLPWYAEREESQMPEYVKQVNKDVVFKLLDSSQNGRRHHDNNEMELAHLFRYGEHYLPATKEEFEDYQTFKKQNV